MIIQYLEYLRDIVFPQMCMLCNQETVSGEKSDFCLACMVNMPYTDHFSNPKNIAASRLSGRIPCVHVASLLNFFTYSDVKHMIHSLKYENRQDIGLRLGKMAGRKALESPFFKNIDIIVPIPLHKSRRRKRGYNQAALIAYGIGEAIGAPVMENIVIKTRNTESQTTKNRAERIKNVFDSFALVDAERLRGRHVLIVDDVLTTGATIQACAQRLLESTDVKISVITASVARG